MLLLLSHVHYLCHFRLSHLVGVDAANANTLLMNMKHDLHGFIMVSVEDTQV